MAPGVAATEFVVAWEFTVAPEHAAAFLATYGPEGEWVRLFRQGRGYRGTELWRDRDTLGRFVTVDRWESADAYQAFRAAFSRPYAELDQACERLTASERTIGTFTPL